eukprot:CAMPEP_0117695964 /NCGR_PEP_ID=MMETSP0804-20121206/28427_1 /TAXON_ID=1074897 /ORGANISM="Tetraselmis astigmatica, Strain CCMP880" /LENGTH=455 /DNA_ID=CAMNT_0005510085 /DNA_START=62 /DNA_END=1428 /DNA_ORIENTATION=+
MTSASPSTKCLFNGALIATFLTLNTSLNLLNRWALGIYGFKYPIVMTTCHMAFSILVLSPWMLCTSVRKTHWEVLKKGWKGIVGIGCFMAVNISFNNLSLVYITLSLNQLIRASLPVLTAMMAVLVEGKAFRGDEFLSLCLLAVGTMLTVYEEWHPPILVGLFSNALMMTFSGKILGEKLDVFRLTFYTSPVSMVVLLPFLYANEWEGFQEYWVTHKGGVLGVLLAGSINAVLYNVVHYLMIQRISSTGTCVVGQVKILGLLVISSFLLGESSEWTALLGIGATIAMAGFVWYSHVNLTKKKDSSKSPNPKASAISGGNTLGQLLSSLSKMPPAFVMLLLVILLCTLGIYSYATGISDLCRIGLKHARRATGVPPHLGPLWTHTDDQHSSEAAGAPPFSGPNKSRMHSLCASPLDMAQSSPGRAPHYRRFSALGPGPLRACDTNCLPQPGLPLYT